MGIFWVIFLVQAVKSTPNGVRFEYYNPQAKSVYLAGDFNNWSTTSHPMRREEDGTFWIVLKLAPGKYEYKFIVDGAWTQDPDNPVTVGVYGNSLVRVGENYAILPPEMATNTPVSSVVNFNLDSRTYVELKRDTVENSKLKYRTFDFMQDLKLDLDANLEDLARLWIRIRYNTKTYRDPSTQLIPLRFERGMFTLNGSGFKFYAFYNNDRVEAFDPFRLLSEVGEFRKNFGDNEQGVMLNLDKFLFLQDVRVLYSNHYREDRDLIYADLGRYLWKIKLGFVYRGQKGLNRLYRVASPDSLRDDRDSLLFFNIYENEELYGPYILLGGKGFSVKMGGLFGQRKVWAGEKYEGDSPIPFTKSWSKAKIWKGIFALNSMAGKWINSLSADYEKHLYDTLFVPNGLRYYTYYRVRAGSSYNGYFGLNFGYTILKTDSFMKWSYLFEDLENQRLSYGEFPLVGYKHYLFLNPFLNLGSKWITFRYEGKLYSYAINQKPYTLENLVRLSLKLKKPILTYELRNFNVKSRFLNISKSYWDHFVELAYPIGKNAQLSINYGYNPWNLEDEYIARREYTQEQGVDYSLLVSNFRGLGTFMDLGEGLLEKERGIQIWLKIAF